MLVMIVSVEGLYRADQIRCGFKTKVIINLGFAKPPWDYRYVICLHHSTAGLDGPAESLK